MPTYQYACTQCGEELEAVQKFSDDPLTECPACGGRLRKVFSAVGVVFKGSGFYKTDSRKSATKKSGDSGSKSDDVTKTDDKPAGGTAGDKPAASGTGSNDSQSSASSGTKTS